MEIEKQQSECIKFLSEPADCAMADEWYEFAQSDHFWMQWRLDNIAKLLPLPYEWGRVLDIGCGNAVVRHQVEQRYGCIVEGCDLNLTALRQALPGKGSLYFYNIYKRHEFFRGKFKTIFLLDVLEHIEDPVSFLDAVGFHLQEGGRIIINVPALQFLYSAYDGIQGHVKRYDFISLKKELEAANFVVEKSTYWGLSMVPFLLLRKLIVRFLSKEKIISTGFQPKNSKIDFILRSLGRIEYRFFPRVPFGTSLMVIARKKN